MTRIRLLAGGLLATGMLLAVAPAAQASTAAPAPATSSASSVAPPPGTCPVVVVHSAEIVRTTSGPAILVTGVKPHADTVLRLEPEDVDYVQPPDYWNYFVVGCGGTGEVVKTPFTTTFPVPSFPMGKYGITVNGIPIDLAGDGSGGAR